jgi:hypothetical protein
VQVGRLAVLAFVAFTVASMGVSASPDTTSGIIQATSPGPEPKPYWTIEDVPGVCDNTQYQEIGNYDDIVALYRSIAQNPKYAGYVKIWSPNQQYGYGNIPGVTGTEKDIWGVRLTNEALGLKKPEVFFPGPPHGDEDIGVQTNVYFAHWILKYALDPECKDMANEGTTEWLKWILDNREIYIWSGMNPYNYNKGRGDYKGRDMNREYDHTQCNGPQGGGGCGSQAIGFLRSVNGATVATFMQKHQVRTGADYHGGTFAMLYSFGASHQTSTGTGRAPGCTRQVEYAPPDFYYFDHFTVMKLDKYMGPNPNSQSFTCSNTGTPFSQVGYNAAGTYLDGWYAGHPAHTKEYTGGKTLIRCYDSASCQNSLLASSDCDPAGSGACKMDLTQVAPNGWTGAGVLWLTPETGAKLISSNWGSDTTKGWASYWRRFHLMMIDWAEPSTRWMPGTPANNSQVPKSTPIDFKWVVNGSMVVDDTQLFWAQSPDPLNDPNKKSAPAHLDFAGKDSGGTGWEGANDGKTQPYIWTDKVTFDTEGDWYVVARAKVDQVYGTPFNTAEYGPDSYLKIIKQRTKPGWCDTIQGEDGEEKMCYKEYWTSPVLKVTVGQDKIPPTVVQTSPADQAANVPPNSKVVVTFSEPMDKPSAENAFGLNPAATGASAWDATGSVMTFTPGAPLQTNTQYTATVGTGAKDVAGNAMAAAKTWAFTTGATSDTSPPYVVSTDPQKGATDINPSKSVTITFNESMDSGTTVAAFSINPAATGTPTLAGSVMTFQASGGLAENTKYTITIAKTAADLAGNAMTADHVFDFTTGKKSSDVDPPSVVSTSPASGLTGIPLNKKIKVTWSEPVVATTAEGGFSTSPATTGTFAWNGVEMTYSPSANLQAQTLYTVTIKQGVEDLAGNKMGSDYSFAFTTGDTADTVPPSIISVTPLDGAVNVPPSGEVVVTFSEPIDPAMIGLDRVNKKYIGFDVNPAPPEGKGEGEFTLWANGAVIKYIPKAYGTGNGSKPSFAENEKYTVSVFKGLEDLAGNALAADYVWSFTTGYHNDVLASFNVGTCPSASACKTDGGLDIETTGKVYLTFNKAMSKAETEAAMSFDPPAQVTVAWKSGDTVAEVTAKGGWKASSMHTVNLKGSAASAKAQPLGEDLSWTFYTKGYKPGTGGGPGDTGVGGFLTSPMGLGIIALIVVAIVGAVLAVALMKRKKRKQKDWQAAYQQQMWSGGGQQGWDQGYGQQGYDQQQGQPQQQQWGPGGGQQGGWQG